MTHIDFVAEGRGTDDPDIEEERDEEDGYRGELELEDEDEEEDEGETIERTGDEETQMNPPNIMRPPASVPWPQRLPETPQVYPNTQHLSSYNYRINTTNANEALSRLRDDVIDRIPGLFNFFTTDRAVGNYESPDEMIDEKLMRRAAGPWGFAREIEDSFFESLNKIKESTTKLPFEGEYSVNVRGKWILIEGYTGAHSVSSLLCDRRTYRITKPFKTDNFIIYGEYTQTGKFRCYSAKTVIGAHFLGTTGSGYAGLCLGELHLPLPTSLNILKDNCRKIEEMFRCINAASMGSTDFRQNEEFQKLMVTPMRWGEKIRAMIEQGILKEII